MSWEYTRVVTYHISGNLLTLGHFLPKDVPGETGGCCLCHMQSSNVCQTIKQDSTQIKINKNTGIFEGKIQCTYSLQKFITTDIYVPFRLT